MQRGAGYRPHICVDDPPRRRGDRENAEPFETASAIRFGLLNIVPGGRMYPRKHVRTANLCPAR